MLQRILGHDNINTTMAYVEVSPRKVQESYLKVMRDGGADRRRRGREPRSILELLKEDATDTGFSRQRRKERP